MTAIFRAVKAGDLEAVRAILAAAPDCVAARDKEDSTPLHWAAWKGHAEIVDALLDAGADPMARNRNGHWGDTPLHAAAHGNQRAAALTLIRRGADLQARDPDGHTPLDETGFHNATAVAKLLREAGAV